MNRSILALIVATTAIPGLSAADDTTAAQNLTACDEQTAYLEAHQVIWPEDVRDNPATEDIKRLFARRATEAMGGSHSYDADGLSSEQFIIGEDKGYKVKIDHDPKIKLPDGRTVTLSINARAESLHQPLDEWEVSASAGSETPVDVTIIHRNHYAENRGPLPESIPASSFFSDGATLRFTHRATGASASIPTRLFLHAAHNLWDFCG